MVPTLYPKASHVVGPVLPYCDRIAIDLLQVIVERPEAKHRTAHLPACISIITVVAMVDPDTCAVVFDHPMDDSRIVDEGNQLVIGLTSHLIWPQGAVPCHWVCQDGPFWLLGLSEEEPVVPIAGKFPVGTLQMLDNWQPIYGNQLSHQVGMVHRHSESDQAATIMPGN